MAKANRMPDRPGMLPNPIVAPKNKKFDDESFILFDRGLERLSKSNMSGTEFSLFFYLLAGPDRLEWVNYRDVDQPAIAVDFGKSQPTISRALKALQSLGLIEQQNRGGARPKSRYRLCPHYSWQGSAKQYQSLEARRDAVDISPRRKWLTQEDV
jgi:DNA-binding transcriptional ArsR family regulator